MSATAEDVTPLSTAAQLAASLEAAKAKEAKAKKVRVDLEERLASILKHPEEGAKTHTCGDYKVTVKGGINRSMDWDQWDQIEADIPEQLRPIETKRALVPAGCKWLRNNEPELWAKIAQAITEKPAKVSVTVKRAE